MSLETRSFSMVSTPPEEEAGQTSTPVHRPRSKAEPGRSKARFTVARRRKKCDTKAKALGYKQLSQVFDGTPGELYEFNGEPSQLLPSDDVEEPPAALLRKTGAPVFDKIRSKSGDTVEQLSLAIYDQLHEDKLPNFLPHVNLNDDGGLCNIGSLWATQRIFWCAFLYLSVCFNVASICMLDWMIFQNYWRIMIGKIAQAMRDKDSVERNPETFLSASLQAEVQDGELEVFAQIDDPCMRRTFETLGALVASAEVICLMVYIFKVVSQCHTFVAFHCRSSDQAEPTSWRPEYWAFRAVHNLLHTTLPQLSTFSALKLVGRVHPSLVYTEYLDYIEEGHKSGCCGTIMQTAWFVFTRALCALTAVVAFAVKVLAVGFKLVHPKEFSWLVRWSQVIALLNNCMGAVLFERVLQERIFLFVFGGSDMAYQDTERALRNVYQCRLAKQIWLEFWKKGERFKAIVLLSTLDHYDLQALIITEEQKDWEEEDPSEANAA